MDADDEAIVVEIDEPNFSIGNITEANDEKVTGYLAASNAAVENVSL